MTNYDEIYDPDIGFDAYLSHITAKRVRDIFKIENCNILDIGSGTGIIANYFYKTNNVYIVEQYPKYIEKLKNKFAPKKIYTQNFMDYDIPEIFDFIFIFNNLQEQEDIESFLLKVSENLSQQGSILITYPNASSIHRVIAKGIGIIKDIELDQSKNSKKYGDKHLLTSEKVKYFISKANLKIKLEEGIFFKPFTNEELEKLDINELDFFNSLSKIYPQNCALNFLEITK